MTDTNKATPGPWQRQPAELDGAGYIVHFRALSRIGKVFVFPCAVGGSTEAEAEANADFLDLLLNSYNPERDKLARELAEEVEEFWKKVDKTQIGEPGIMIPAPSREKARQLLKLYEQDK